MARPFDHAGGRSGSLAISGRRGRDRGGVPVRARLRLGTHPGGGAAQPQHRPPAPPPATSCDDGIKQRFHPDPRTTVLLVQAFPAGTPIALANTPADPAPGAAPADVCLVKLLVGPGNPGDPAAPSTSPGIGIEVWLPTPTNWNGIIRSYGSGGWAGGFQADTTGIGGTGSIDPMHLAAVGKGYVVSTSDHGHGGSNDSGGNGSFTVNPDGTHQHRRVAGLLRAQHARAGREDQGTGQGLLRQRRSATRTGTASRRADVRATRSLRRSPTTTTASSPALRPSTGAGSSPPSCTRRS